MLVSIIVNGRKVEFGELKDIVIRDEVVSGLVRKVAKRQRERAGREKSNDTN